MKTRLFQFATLLSFVLFFSLFSCEQPEQPDSLSAEDEAKGSFIVADAFAMANGQADGGKTLFSCGNDGTFEAAAIDTGFKMTFVNCEHNGVVRNGSLILTVNDWSVVGASMTIAFENYSVDGDAVTGAITVSRSGLTKMNVVSENMSCALINGESFSWSSNLTFALTLNTLGDFTDNTYKLSGGGTGVNREGQSYTSEYDDVEVSGMCQWPVSGKISITQGNTPTVVDFGSGDCDNSIEVSKGSFSTTIEL